MSSSPRVPPPDSANFDIDARERQVLGKPQRIEPLKAEDFDDEARALVINVRESLGIREHSVMPEAFATMLKHPGLYRCQMEMGTAIFQGKIPPRERELAVLRCGWLCRAPFEWGEHVDIGKRYGLTTEEVERVTQGSSAPGWSEHEAAILRGVEELIADQALSDATWDVLAKSWDEQQLFEFPMMVGQYVATAFVQNSLRIRLADDNPGLSYR